MMREIPKGKMVGKTIKLDLRKEIEEELRKSSSAVQEIRMREIGFNRGNLDGEVKLKIVKYKASGGNEYFLELVNKNNVLFGLLRLRVWNKNARIRELHVYGQAVELGKKQSLAFQHSGFGKILMCEAEKITKEQGISEISVISGVGVREYYRKLGYKLKSPYMVKNLD
jgi:elongator complex protein 3